ncbi:DEAD/DEAH box helicase [Rickettsia bellii]|uniref:AAA domain protein n=1 Tax=Rickettsia bellii str. RML Mogi TaxID=1359194 RepID=A0A0F3QIQ1_RICBE|nr:AAA domain-containing protein [Rickettsia bellii]KJV92470.1 AAA domain protein [Rickettsia bellii str. RML Mogi]
MYNQSDEQVKNVLDVWKIIEVLTPFKNDTLTKYFEAIEEYKEGQDKREKFYHKLKDHEALYLLKDAPFENFDKSELKIDLTKSKVEVYWNIYLGYLKWSEAEVAILKKINKLSQINEEVLQDHINQNNLALTPIAALTIDENMIYMPNTMVISTAAYALGEITRHDFCEEDFKKLINFNDVDNNLINEALNFAEITPLGERKLNLESIKNIINFLVEEFAIDQKYLVSHSEICVRRVVSIEEIDEEKEDKQNFKDISKNENANFSKVPSLEIFNSFFLKPLSFVRYNIKNISNGSAISKYLGKENKPDSIDVLENIDVLKDLLSPNKMSFSRWPSSPQNSPAALQAAAVNTMLLNSSENLFAVNGPPGTGKTTLMFDIIANLYVERALKLTDLACPTDGFGKDKKNYPNPPSSKVFTHYIKALKPELQNYGMVVASSNNNAVENISKEISLYSKIDTLYHKDLSYFKQLVPNKDKNLSWGTFAAALGNNKNKAKFTNKFWKYKKNQQNKDDKREVHHAMLQYLNLLVNNKCEDKAPEHYKPEYYSAGIKDEWNKACTEFLTLHKEIDQTYKYIESVIDLNKERHSILKKHDIYEDNEHTKKYLESILTNTKNQIELNKRKIDDYDLGYFKSLHKLFKTRTYRTHKELLQRHEDQLNYEKSIVNDLKRLMDIGELLLEPHRFLKNRNFDVEAFENDSFWDKKLSDLHKTQPCFNIEFEKLKSKLFIQAVKLHEIFIHANADSFWHSLKYFFDIVMNSSIAGDTEMNKIAWQNFFTVIPLVSTTFHSFDRMFDSVGHNEISWLLVDEAGQIPPQYAASAIFKSKNVIIVGDPMQTEPVSILKQDLTEALCKKFNILSTDWSPHKVSVQHLADRNSLYQTKYSKSTVGFPLLVHRRCQNPMFDIFNKIAYDNKMIYAVAPPELVIRKILKTSRWINVVDNNIKKSKHESEAEFNALLEILEPILKHPDSAELLNQIYIITMYKSFSLYIQKSIKDKFLALSKNQKIPKKLQNFCTNNIGTIHAFQGKENDTVIMMLGAQRPQDTSTRNVMTKKPNVLNVGISRAKNNLYIIGNAEIWLKHDYMKDIYNMLS